MSIPLQTLCNIAIEALRDSKYQESTINEYSKTFSQFRAFAQKHDTDIYSRELGEMFRSDTISERTGKYSLYRWKRRNRCVEMFDWYEAHGYFNLNIYTRPRIDTPGTIPFQKLHLKYLSYISSEGLKPNTIDSFRNVSCKFLQFLEKRGYSSLVSVSPDNVFSFVIELRKAWAEESLRTAVSVLRSFFRFAEEPSLIKAANYIRTVRARTIIPILSDEEENLIWNVLNLDERVTKRDKAIVLLSLMTGLRACDIVNLQTKDIDWQSESITIIQQKTGNILAVPLLPAVGNAIADYILKERPKIGSGYLFIRQLAPYLPLSGHSPCYRIIRMVFKYAGIQKCAGFCGTRLLRHNAASKLLKKGVPVETIAAVLGHSDSDSTEIYLTTDDIRMRECGLPLSSVPIREGGLL